MLQFSDPLVPRKPSASTTRSASSSASETDLVAAPTLFLSTTFGTERLDCNIGVSSEAVMQGAEGNPTRNRR